MMLPWRGTTRGTQMTTRASPWPALSITASMSDWPPIVSLATARIVRTGYSPPAGAGPAVAPAVAAGTSGFLKTPWTAPGTPYSYGPPTTVGRLSKLKMGGGEDTCHSRVRAFQGFEDARGPPRQDATML